MQSRWEKKKKVVYAVSGSVLIHMLTVIALGIIFSYSPVPREETPEPDPEPEVMEITIMPPLPAPEPEETPFLDVPENLASKEKPENPSFESAVNSLAASEIPPAGEAKSPSQEGRDSDSIELENRDYTPGEKPLPSVPSPPTPPAPPEEPRPTPIPEEPSKPEPTPPPDAIAMLAPTPTPTPAKEESLEEKQTIEESNLPQPPSQPVRPSLPGYQPERRQTRVEGSVNSRGQTSVDAIGTPLGKFKKQLSDAIGSRWYFYTNSQIDKISIGAAKVKFYVNEDGKVEDLEIISNDSNETFATFTLQAIVEAEIPKIPDDIADTLPARRLEVEYTFTVYGR